MAKIVTKIFLATEKPIEKKAIKNDSPLLLATMLYSIYAK